MATPDGCTLEIYNVSGAPQVLRVVDPEHKVRAEGSPPASARSISQALSLDGSQARPASGSKDAPLVANEDLSRPPTATSAATKSDESRSQAGEDQEMVQPAEGPKALASLSACAVAARRFGETISVDGLSLSAQVSPRSVRACSALATGVHALPNFWICIVRRQHRRR